MYHDAQIVLPAGYLQAVYGFVRAAGGVCIADEVQVMTVSRAPFTSMSALAVAFRML